MKNSDFIHKHKRYTSKLLAACVVLSFLGHAFATVLFERFGAYSFGKPINEPASIMIELSQTTVSPITSLVQQSVQTKPAAKSQSRTIRTDVKKVVHPTNISDAMPLSPPIPQQQQVLSHAPPSTPPNASSVLTQMAATKQPPQENVYIQADQIVPIEQEKLIYQISLAGVPVASAQLEASNSNGEIRIKSTIRSNSVVSSIYIVNDSTDTRLIKGRFLLTRIKQHEGLLKSDTGFTIMYPDRKIFWVDRLKKRYSNEPLESLDTLDFVSGFYFMRQQPLAVGNNMTLRLYDGDTTTVVPVAVLRKETISLPGMRTADTLVVQPQFAASGFFRNNRDLLVWFSNDENRVPVRFEATTPIGRVTAELVSSERATNTSSASTIVAEKKMQYN